MPKKPALNLYGDTKTPTASGHGVDIASQRMDDLDQASIDEVIRLSATNTVRPLVYDLGCGFGAQSVRLAAAGATVMAFDLDDNREEIRSRAVADGVAEHVSFVQLDIRKGLMPLLAKPKVIYSQRTLHYLTFDEAKALLVMLANKNTGPMTFFLSVSGMRSELGEGYTGRELHVHRRYAELSPSMQEKHAIYGNVCLYTVSDMMELLKEAGLKGVSVYASPFGNIKAIAEKAVV
jgi:SAM-dependent methyltransferase